MTLRCKTCGRTYDSRGMGEPRCPSCGDVGSDILEADVAIGADVPGTVRMPKRQDLADHAAALATTTEFACVNGHRFSWAPGQADYGDCPHGVRWNDQKQAHENVQVDLHCPACGAGLSVVGPVGRRACPRCGRPMICPQCATSVVDTPPERVACPVCGSTNLSVVAAPPVVFTGAVRKTITLGG